MPRTFIAINLNTGIGRKQMWTGNQDLREDFWLTTRVFLAQQSEDLCWTTFPLSSFPPLRSPTLFIDPSQQIQIMSAEDMEFEEGELEDDETPYEQEEGVWNDKPAENEEVT